MADYQHWSRLVKRNLLLDVLLRHVMKIFGWLQIVDSLQSDGRAPVGGTLRLLRLALVQVFFEQRGGGVVVVWHGGYFSL